MAKIPTYQSQPQGLGGTTKLSGSDPVNAALQQLGGQMQNLGQAVKKYEAAKDIGSDASVELSYKTALQTNEKEFQGLITDPNSGVTEEMRADWFEERMGSEGWWGTVGESFEGSDKLYKHLEDQYAIKNKDLWLQNNNKSKMFGLQRYGVNVTNALEAAVFTRDEEAVAKHSSSYEAFYGAENLDKFMSNAEAVLANQDLAQIQGIEELREARASMESGEAWKAYPNVKEDKKRTILNANIAQETKMMQIKEDQQNENYAVALLDPNLTPEAVTQMHTAGQAWNGAGDEAGFSTIKSVALHNEIDRREKERIRLLEKDERDKLTQERQMQNESSYNLQIEIDEERAGLTDIYEAYQSGDIRQNQYFQRKAQLERNQGATVQQGEIVNDYVDFVETINPKKRPMGAEIGLDERIDEVLASSMTDEEQAGAIRMLSVAYFKLQKNPQTSPQIRKGIYKLARLSADAVELGISDDEISAPINFLSAFADGAKPEEIDQALQNQLQAMDDVIKETVLERIRINDPIGREQDSEVLNVYNTVEEAESAGLPAGTIVWIGDKKARID